MTTRSNPLSSPARAIPVKLNLVIAIAQVIALAGLLWGAGRLPFWPWSPLLAIGYALAMNSAYLMQHEAEHGLLHPRRGLNDGLGVLLALFFPAPFHLLRQGHLGHHVRNRTDDEAFDHYFPGDNVFWKHWAFYNILIGGFWLCITLSNVVLPFRPRLWSAKASHFDRATDALLESLNPRYDWLIRIEAIAILGLHGALIATGIVPVWSWLTLMGAFGISWSSMQYMHHYDTPRDIHKGARNLRTFRWLDALWLNHNWHQRHHEHPNVPWIYLPEIEEGPNADRESMYGAWRNQWHGPMAAQEPVINRHAGQRIR